jgi:DNA polymerase
VLAGLAIWAAWNMGFDRAIWNFATIDFPLLSPEQTIDVMAQAVASGLPADLNMGAKMSGATHKMASGKSLISLFCIPGAAGTPLSHPAEWAAFRDYAAGDIEAMRDVYKRTMPLAPDEWSEYWAMERINERGIAIDLPMVEAAARLADEDKERSSRELLELTGGEVRTVDQSSG